MWRLPRPTSDVVTRIGAPRDVGDPSRERGHDFEFFECPACGSHHCVAVPACGRCGRAPVQLVRDDRQLSIRAVRSVGERSQSERPTCPLPSPSQPEGLALRFSPVLL